MYQWCEFKSRRGKNKNLTAQKSNSSTVWFNFQTYIYIYIYIQWDLSNPTHQGTRESVGLYRMSEYSNFIYVNRTLWDHNFLSDITGCRKTQVSDCTGSTVYIYIGLGLWCLTPRSTIFQNYISWQSVLLVGGIH